MTEWPQIQQVTLESISVETHSAVFTVVVFNPNSIKIPVRSVDGQLKLNAVTVAMFEAKSKTSLAAKSATTFRVPVQLKQSELTSAIQTTFLTGKANYEITAYMMTPIGEVPIQETGDITQEQLLMLLQSFSSM
jgi:LEA14-like dessication related protein